LVNEVRFWSTKYLSMSYLLGANFTFFAYHLAFKHLKLYVGIPLTVATFFVSRNLIMKNCMERVYWPVEGVYNRLREEQKKKKEESKVRKPRVEATSEDLKKMQLMNENKAALSAEQIAE
jgi:hypothetical protein